MNKIQAEIDKMETVNPEKLVVVITVVILAGWLTFALGAWNHNLFLAVLAMAIPAVAFRVFFGRKISKLGTLEMIVFGILLWNHMVAIIITLFIIKLLVSEIRK